MPLYFFDLYDEGLLWPDEFGIELSGFEEARDQAIRLLPALARDAFPAGERRDFICELKDAAKRPIYRAKLSYQGERLIHEGERPRDRDASRSAEQARPWC